MSRCVQYPSPAYQRGFLRVLVGERFRYGVSALFMSSMPVRLSLFVWGFLVCYNLLFASVNGW